MEQQNAAPQHAAPWLAFANQVLQQPLPVSPTDSQGYAAMRSLLCDATLAHVDGDAETERICLQTLVFVAQHYAHEAFAHLTLQQAAQAEEGMRYDN